MTTYIDTTYVDAFITTNTRTALFNDAGAGYSSTNFDVIVAAASARVKAALHHAGYTQIGESLSGVSTDAADFIKEATLGQFLILAYGARRGISIPEGLASTINIAEAIRSGNIRVPGIEPAARTAVGGVEFTPSDPDDAEGIADATTKPQAFRHLRTSW